MDRAAPNTFAIKKEVEIWLTKKEAELLAGYWLNPDLGKVNFKEYGSAWIDERPGLRPKKFSSTRVFSAFTSSRLSATAP
ncbi:hypothetical protein ACQEVF_14015 [Nonomuraea polychroma]|uniref:hypothetical protein n=1 Tax=Nonomuraea polychroma TaxID=46176 RepID=UPI003D9270A5